MFARLIAFAWFVFFAVPAFAGPPFATDDPEPTERGHWEIYAFGSGTHRADGSDGAAGLDLNYGGAEDLQLTMTLPVRYDHPRNTPMVGGLSNVEIAAKYRFLHQDENGVDVAIFPRVFLPSASPHVGERHAAVLLPVWLQKDFGPWSVFGGGGCAYNHGGDSKNYCVAGGVIQRQVTPKLQVGVEIFHQTADVRDGHASTTIGLGSHYDLSETLHIVASISPGLQRPDENGRYNWYAALLFTF